MQFKDIIGQEATKSRFIQTVNANRVSHAQLIVGEKGVGKLAMAIAFAQYVSCQNKQANDSCGQCASCKKYQKLFSHFFSAFLVQMASVISILRNH